MKSRSRRNQKKNKKQSDLKGKTNTTENADAGTSADTVGNTVIAKGKPRSLSNLVKTVKCPQCPFQSQSKTGLKRHQKQAHSTPNKNNLSFASVSPASTESFSDTVDLASHSLAHSSATAAEENNYVCNVCTTTFRTKKALNCHLQAHDTDTDTSKNFMCTFKSCDFSCSNFKKLQKHIGKNHTKKSGYDCSICSYKCKSSRDLKRHSVAKHQKLKNPATPKESNEEKQNKSEKKKVLSGSLATATPDIESQTKSESEPDAVAESSMQAESDIHNGINTEPLKEIEDESIDDSKTPISFEKIDEPELSDDGSESLFGDEDEVIEEVTLSSDSDKAIATTHSETEANRSILSKAEAVPELHPETVERMSEESAENNKKRDEISDSSNSNNGEDQGLANLERNCEVSQVKLNADPTSSTDKKKKNYQCEVPDCDFQTKELIKFTAHIQFHRTMGIAFCEHCSFITYSRNTLTQHLRVRHSDIVTSPKASPARSKLTHSGVTYACNFCVKKFSREITYLNHLRQHTGEKFPRGKLL